MNFGAIEDYLAEPNLRLLKMLTNPQSQRATAMCFMIFIIRIVIVLYIFIDLFYTVDVLTRKM